MNVLFWFAVFAVSLVVLVLAARYFTKAAEVIGLALGMSRFVTGVLIVSIGTSLPELVASVVAVAKGSPGIVAGNVIGASISNLFFVLGVAAYFSKKSIDL